MEEFGIAALPLGYKTTLHAQVLGTGMALGALPKTVYNIISSRGIGDIIYWYHVSSEGVNNYPDVHKH